MKILVVDDEPLLVKGIRFNLQNDGYEVVTGSDGAEAIELARDPAVGLIVLDVMMPRVDGLEACRRIREFSDVPIIMLTARKTRFFCRECYNVAFYRGIDRSKRGLIEIIIGIEQSNEITDDAHIAAAVASPEKLPRVAVIRSAWVDAIEQHVRVEQQPMHSRAPSWRVARHRKGLRIAD